MRVSILLSVSVLLVSDSGAQAKPFDVDAGTIDPALLSQQSGPSQQPDSGQPSAGHAGNPTVLKVHEERGRQVNAWLFATDLNELDPMLAKYHKHPDPRGRQWQRTSPGRNWVRDHWSCEDMTQPLSDKGLIGLEESISHLTISPPTGLSVRKPDILQPSVALYPHGPWVNIKVTQDRDYTTFSFAEWPVSENARYGGAAGEWFKTTTKHKMKEYKATGTSYENLYNIVDGILIIQGTQKNRQREGSPGSSSVSSPTAPLSDLQLPASYPWAATTFYLWNDLRAGSDSRGKGYKRWCLQFGSKGGNSNDLDRFWPYGDANRELRKQQNSGMYSRVEHLNYIILPDVVDQALLGIIKECLLSRGFSNTPDMENRAAFGVGHWCFYALLGAGGNQNIALLLAQHRDSDTRGTGEGRALSHKIIKSISIFKPAEKNRPSLLFSIVDYDITWDMAKAATEAAWLPGVFSGGRYAPVDVDCGWDL